MLKWKSLSFLSVIPLLFSCEPLPQNPPDEVNIFIDSPTKTLTKGLKYQLDYHLEGEYNVHNLTFSSSNEDVINVTPTGEIEALNEGSSTITLSYKDKSKDIVFEVEEKEVNQTYLDLVSESKLTNVRLVEDDVSAPLLTSIDESYPEGEAKNPLSHEEVETIEIISIEQPVEYGDAFLIMLDDISIVMDLGNFASEYFDDGTNYGQYLSEIYQTYVPDRELDVLILTHPHADHYGGYPALTASFDKINYIFDYGYQDGSAYIDNVRLNYYSKGAKYRSIYDVTHGVDNLSSRFYLAPNAFFDWIDTGLYNPVLTSSSLYSDENVTSIVGILNFNNFSLLFNGDLQGEASYGDEGIDGEASLLENNLNNPLFHQVSMLKVAHHGSYLATTYPLLNKLNPQIAIISAGRPASEESYAGTYGICAGHPHDQTIERLYNYQERRETEVYLNYLNGTTHFISDGLTSLYMHGSPLKSNLYGAWRSEVNYSIGDTSEMFNEIKDTSYYRTCVLGL